ncbi:MAG TPA: protein-L-isoaspartate(D-aspartate) O-methyltransferase [Phycisphaerae bacterium]|nr:protein-L-isoaspartate(D-aspartate) O-methyltransferase [Phycisphaerae bacterium]
MHQRTPVWAVILGLILVGPVGCSSQSERAADTQPSATQPATSAPATQAAWPPIPPAASQYVDLRNAMVRSQMAEPDDARRPITDPQVLQAMRTAPRHVFAPGHLASTAYGDWPLPIGYDQTISQPYIVALMSELLSLTPQSHVLEIGTGSGYQAAVLAHLTPHVYTIEIVEPLARRAQQTLREQGYETVHCRIGDGHGGWPEAAPFDGIIVTCAADQVPQPLWDQLAPGGRIVIPIGRPDSIQRLEVITKTPDGQRERRTVIPVRFVPMTGKKK